METLDGQHAPEPDRITLRWRVEALTPANAERLAARDDLNRQITEHWGARTRGRSGKVIFNGDKSTAVATQAGSEPAKPWAHRWSARPDSAR